MLLGTQRSDDIVSAKFFLEAIQTEVHPDERKRIATAMRSVAMITRPGKGPCTGFLIAGDLLVTARHVLPNKAAARLATVVFNFDHEDSSVTQTKRYTLDPDATFVTSHEDWVVVRVAGGAVGAVNAAWGALVLVREVADGDVLQCVYHGDGLPRQIARNAGRVHSTAAGTIKHDVATTQGASGAPLFNQQWNVVGIHTGYDDDPVGIVSGEHGVRMFNVGVTVEQMMSCVASLRSHHATTPRIGTSPLGASMYGLEEVYPGYLEIIDPDTAREVGQLIVEANFKEHWFLYTKDDFASNKQTYLWPGDGNNGSAKSVQLKFVFVSTKLPFDPAKPSTVTAYRASLLPHGYYQHTVTKMP
jgi:V8-like Glu-specific endopeptidase